MDSNYSNIDKIIEITHSFCFMKNKEMIDVVNEYISTDEWIIISVFYGNQHIDDTRFLLGHIKQQKSNSPEQ